MCGGVATQWVVDTLERVLEARRERDFAEHELYATIALLYRIWEQIRYFRTAKTVALQRAGLMRPPGTASANPTPTSSAPQQQAASQQQAAAAEEQAARARAQFAEAQRVYNEALAAHTAAHAQAVQQKQAAAMEASVSATTASAQLLAAQRAVEAASQSYEQVKAARVVAAGMNDPNLSSQPSADGSAAPPQPAAAGAETAEQKQQRLDGYAREDAAHSAELARLQSEVQRLQAVATAAQATARQTAADAQTAAAAPVPPMTQPQPPVPPPAMAADGAGGSAGLGAGQSPVSMAQPYRETDRQLDYKELKSQVMGNKYVAVCWVLWRVLPDACLVLDVM
jgi:hypothetical protein